jgi:hypothetical protein
MDGAVEGANKPSKEAHFHLAAYRARPDAKAVVHLHSTYATAVSCLSDLDVEDAMPIFTPYYAMRLPKLPVVEYYPPGDPQLGPDVERRAAESPRFCCAIMDPLRSAQRCARRRHWPRRSKSRPSCGSCWASVDGGSTRAGRRIEEEVPMIFRSGGG